MKNIIFTADISQKETKFAFENVRDLPSTDNTKLAIVYVFV